MPDPIPVVVMGRLAIDKRYQRMVLGSGLLKDTVLRALNTAETLGITAMLMNAISEDAKNFYLANGFVESPTQPLTLCPRLDKARKIILPLTIPSRLIERSCLRHPLWRFSSKRLLREAEALLRDQHRPNAFVRRRENRVGNRGQDWRPEPLQNHFPGKIVDK